MRDMVADLGHLRWIRSWRPAGDRSLPPADKKRTNGIALKIERKVDLEIFRKIFRKFSKKLLKKFRMNPERLPNNL